MTKIDRAAKRIKFALVFRSMLPSFANKNSQILTQSLALGRGRLGHPARPRASEHNRAEVFGQRLLAQATGAVHAPSSCMKIYFHWAWSCELTPERRYCDRLFGTHNVFLLVMQPAGVAASCSLLCLSLFSISLFLIADIESPCAGIIRVHAQNLESLAAFLQSQ